jgi:putative colanic acid biosynthesis glycosyltransferase
MRVLQVNSVCGVGSTGRIATDIHHELIADGHASMIAFGRGEPKNCDATYRIGSTANILRDVFMTRLFDLHGSAGKRATRAFCAMIEEFHPDVVHLHNIHGYYLNIEILMDYLKKSNYPVVWTLHDCWSFTGHCAYFDFPKCTRWENTCGKCPRKYDYPASLCIDRSRQNRKDKIRYFMEFDNLRLVTPSYWLKDLVGRSFLSGYQVNVVPNGIDISKFKPVATNLRNTLNLGGKKIILGVAMIWDRRKGLEDMIRLSIDLGRDYQVILIGLTHKQIEKLPAEILGIQRTTSVEELAAYYSMADVTVISSYEDNYPTVVLESLACHTPVVGYATGGIPEMGHEPYLRVVPKGAMDKLREAVVASEKDLPWNVDFASMNKRTSALKYLDIYRKVISKGG